MDFPTLMYRKGGVHQMKGGTFSFIEVIDEADRDVRLAEGWVDTMPELDAVVAKLEKEEEIDKVSPPTRAELETKAKELGLEFHHKIGDKKLLALINKALV